MNKVFKLILVISLLGLWACGSKKNPTGGKEDTEKPALTSSLPEEYADISNRVLELTFSKYLDKSSVISGLYIYPLIQNKKVTVDRNKIIIRISEQLLADTNYFVTLSTRIKDIRGNALAENQTLIYASGTLQRNRLSGVINYEDVKDRAYSMQFNLFSADSLQILSKQIVGGAFALDALNPVPYIYRAFIDKNSNGRYDLDIEPWAEGKVNVKGIASIEMNLSYVDTVLAKVNSVQPVSDRELIVTFSEPIASLAEIRINRTGGEDLPVIAQHLDDNKLTVITAGQSKAEYQITFSGITDRKANVTGSARYSFWATGKPDTNGPSVISSKPRNGTSLAVYRPELIVNFSELIDPKTIMLRLVSEGDGQAIDFELLPSNPDQIRISPRYNLKANRSYTLEIDKKLKDYSGNQLSENYSLKFLILNPK